ncbi:hypothetical protein HanXRQr2_Chr12g0534811 [Helianthus annuus]|uniref:Uncharacterized protein n=1 Tax=Helianthus annuus TaxID=4232 RepID=A0A9K3MVJ8_HELAN|nr:hypothetical protein HanXRQr2_Chr12g0534811 [Helianthus annuus]KAJ0862179.1 hypothetical protein HanPSC8_Chr12g0515141 [Helianthus annuus]
MANLYDRSGKQPFDHLCSSFNNDWKPFDEHWRRCRNTLLSLT